MLLSIIFLTDLFETSYLRMYWTDLYQIAGEVPIRATIINLTFRSRSLNGCCYGNRFLVRIGEKLAYPTFILCSCIPQ